MALSSGGATLIKMVGGWVVASGIAVAAVIYQEDVRTALGLRITAEDLQAAVRDVEAQPVEAPSKRSDRTVEIRAGNNGHFETTAYINGRPIQVLVDTGATTVALPFEDAEAAGIFVRESDYTQRVQTANGTARVAAVMLQSVTIDDITVRNVRAAVAEPGKLQTTLLGMSFLGRLSRTEMSKGILVLQE